MVPPRILIVDNEPTVGYALKRLLEARGAMQAVTVLCSDDAEAELSRGAVDALILDYHLTGMRGDAFYYRACELQPSLAQRTVFITGDPSPQANDAITSTGRPLLVKPFLVSELLLEMQAMFATVPSRQARTA
jgi:CheY-like chemotaxis protein